MSEFVTFRTDKAYDDIPAYTPEDDLLEAESVHIGDRYEDKPSSKRKGKTAEPADDREIKPGKARYLTTTVTPETQLILTKKASIMNMSMPEYLTKVLTDDAERPPETAGPKLAARISLFALVRELKDRQRAAEELDYARRMIPDYGEPGDEERIEEIAATLGLDADRRLLEGEQKIVELVSKEVKITFREVSQRTHLLKDQLEPIVESLVQSGAILSKQEGKSRLLMAPSKADD